MRQLMKEEVRARLLPPPPSRFDRFLNARTMADFRDLQLTYGLTLRQVVEEHKDALRTKYGVAFR
jgi:hypothetical protein